MLSLEQPEPGSALADAIADRQAGLLRAHERGLALAPGAPLEAGSGGAGRSLSEALLRRALQCLAESSEYSLARRLVAEGSLAATPSLLVEVSRQALAQAGLATWNPATGELRGTALVAALMRFFEAGIEGVRNQASP